MALASEQSHNHQARRQVPPQSKTLRAQLWAGVVERLEAGEAMTTNEHFYLALADRYAELTGAEPSDDVLLQLQKMVADVNETHPETYLAQGVQNGVRKAFEFGIRKLNWDLSKIQAMGTSSMRRFAHQPEVLELLEEFHLQPGQIDLVECITGILRDLSPDHGPATVGEHAASGDGAHMSFADLVRAAEGISPGISESLPATAETASPTPTPSQSPSARPETGAGARPKVTGRTQLPSTSKAELQAAVATGEVDQGELTQRSAQQERVRKQIAKREEERLDDNLDGYVDMGILSEEEAGQLKALQEVDDKLKRGEISEKDADRIRNSILKGDARSALERKIREAVDHAVIYLQVYQAMQRIAERNDPALLYLIRNKELVTAQQLSAQGVSATMQALMDDVPLLEGLVDLMERKDQEVRMLSVRLPPYNAIAGRGLERIGNMIIEEEFVAELRSLDEDQMSQRLNSPDQAVRVRPAADMRCFISLIDHLTKRTPFRKQLRLLRVNLSLEQLFRETKDLKQARNQAENFLERRLRRLFPDLSTDEGSEIKLRGAQMIDDIEQRILAERQQGVAEKREKTKAPVVKEKPVASDGGGDEMELTDEERNKGVQIGRVETRVGGGMRRIPLKIMPDEDDPTYFVIVQRDPETGELAPQMRRGQKRLVEKGKDGMWRSVK